MRYSLFPHFIFSVYFVLGYLTWPHSWDPLFIFTIVMFMGGVGDTSHTPRMIQVDISGHPPFPTGSKQFSGNFGNLLFLAGFNFRGHFEGLNEVFWGSSFSMIVKGSD